MALLNITKSDILTALGVDLEFELAIDDDPSGKVKRFINDVQEWCYDYLRFHYGLNEDISLALAWRQDYFKKGVIKQIEYVLRNGKLSIDSGFIRSTSLVIDLKGLELAPDAKQKFFLGGFCNVVRA